MPTLDYQFSVPLLEVDGYETSDLEGVAEIEYSSSGEWDVKDIYLDAARYDWQAPVGSPQRRKERPIKVEGEIYKLIHERMMDGKRWRFIGYEVREQIERDREPDPDVERERRRDDALIFGAA